MEMPTYFGVRHLSPGAAYHLRKALDREKPELILVEGPSDLNDQMQWLCHPETKYPVAILAYTKKPPVQTILYPFAYYSPEVQAILWAKEHKVPCRFMDLPSSVFLAMEEKQDIEPKEQDSVIRQAHSIKQNSVTEQAGVVEENSKTEQTNSMEFSCSTEFVYEKLEMLTGEDHDTFWERNFEQTEDYQRASNTFGRELRNSVCDTKHRIAENIVREAYMKRVICEAIDSGIPAHKIFCVCGAFHVEGLKENIPMTNKEVDELSTVESAATLMPYSYYRLSSRSGYGAGNKAPAYFHMLWEAWNGDGLQGAATTYLVKLADAHRKAGNIVSSAEVIDAVKLANVLRQIRGSKYPCLQDLKDAAIATMGHGNLSELAIAFADVEIGRTIGYLPEGVSRTSVQEDFYRQLKLLKLERFRSAELQKLDLDLREKLTVKSKEAAFLDLHRSFFLHRLQVLNIHFAAPLTSKQDKANWGEYWELRWTPEVEIEVVESALLGDTIQDATAFALKERAEQATTISEAAAIFQNAFLCGMPAAATHALTVLQGLSVDTAALTEVAATADRLSVVVRYGDLRKFDAAVVIPLIQQLFLRACFTLEEACNCDVKAASDITKAMDSLNSLQLNHDFLDEVTWIQLLEKISDRDDLNTKCSGFAMAVLLERGAVTEELLSREVSRRLSPSVPADLGAGWFEGLAAKNRYALIARLSLWRHLSDYLDNLDDRTFRRALVFLRRAFADFTPAEKNDIAENLGEVWGIHAQQVAEVLMQETTQEEQAVLAELDDFDFDDI